MTTRLDDNTIVVLNRCTDEAFRSGAKTFLEFGVARGGTTCMFSIIIRDHAASTKLYSFDSFYGFFSEEWKPR